MGPSSGGPDSSGLLEALKKMIKDTEADLKIQINNVNHDLGIEINNLQKKTEDDMKDLEERLNNLVISTKLKDDEQQKDIDFLLK